MSTISISTLPELVKQTRFQISMILCFWRLCRFWIFEQRKTTSHANNFAPVARIPIVSARDDVSPGGKSTLLLWKPTEVSKSCGWTNSHEPKSWKLAQEPKLARNLTPPPPEKLLNKDSCWDSQMDTIWSSKSLVLGRSSSYFPKNTRFFTVFWKFMIFPPLVSSWPSGVGFSILKKVCFALHRGLWTPQNHCFQGLWMHPTILKWKMKKLRFLSLPKNYHCDSAWRAFGWNEWFEADFSQKINEK